MWLNTWLTVLVVMAWIVIAMLIVQVGSDLTVVIVACMLGVIVPPIAYPAAKMTMVGLLLRLDPPSPHTTGARRL